MSSHLSGQHIEEEEEEEDGDDDDDDEEPQADSHSLFETRTLRRSLQWFFSHCKGALIYFLLSLTYVCFF